MRIASFHAISLCDLLQEDKMAPANEKKQDSRIVFAVTKSAIEQMEDSEQAWNSIAVKQQQRWQEFLHEQMPEYRGLKVLESCAPALDLLDWNWGWKLSGPTMWLDAQWKNVQDTEEYAEQSRIDWLEDFNSHSEAMKVQLMMEDMWNSIKFNALEIWVNAWNMKMDNDTRLFEFVNDDVITQDEWFEVFSKSWLSWERDNTIFMDFKFHNEQQMESILSVMSMSIQQSFYDFRVKSYMKNYKFWLRHQMRQDRILGRGQERDQSWEKIHARHVADYHEWLRDEL